jgi:hypothetical protein
MIEDWREDYNNHRPHSSLSMMVPARFAQTWKTQQDALMASATPAPNANHQLSYAVDQ